MKTSVTLKHTLSCLPDLELQVDIDPERLEVTLTCEHFDSSLVACYVMRILPAELGVCAFREDAAARGEIGRTPASVYRLFVVFAGRRHLAQVVRLINGGVTVWLQAPVTEAAPGPAR